MVMLAPQYNAAPQYPAPYSPLTNGQRRVIHTANLAKTEKSIEKLSRTISNDRVLYNIGMGHLDRPGSDNAATHSKLARILRRLQRNTRKHSQLCHLRDSLVTGYAAICKEVGP